MKKVLLFALCIVATGLTACSEDEPKHHTTVHHYYHDSGPAVNSPSNEGADNFRANTKPDSY